VHFKLIYKFLKNYKFSGRYLNYYSHHPTNHKKGVIFGLTDKIINLSHPRFPSEIHQKNFIECIHLLLKNGMPEMNPLDFIFSNIQNRIKKLFQLESHNFPIIPHTSDEPQKIFSQFHI